MPRDLSFQQKDVSAEVTRKWEGKRLDHFLTDKFYWRSRNYFQRMIDRKQVLIDGKPAKKASRRVRVGQVVTIPVPEAELKLTRSEDIPLNFVYEDEHIVVVNKQPHLVVHPNSGHPFGTLLNAMFYHYRHREKLGEDITPRLVHRIDQFTSGLVLMTKDDDVHRELQRQFN